MAIPTVLHSLHFPSFARAYHERSDRTHQASPPPDSDLEMQTELRNRAVTGAVPRVIVENASSSPQSEQTLTPSSSEDQYQPEGKNTVELPFAIGRLLICMKRSE